MDNISIGDVVRVHDNSFSNLVIGEDFAVTAVRGEFIDIINKQKSHIGCRSTRFKKVIVASKADNMKTGMKYDSGKLLWRPLMRGLARPLAAVTAVLTYGAQKYALDSWQTVPDGKNRYEDAMYRHLNAYNSGEKFDQESGLHHLAHVACNALFVLWFEMDRNPTVSYVDFNKPPQEGK